MFQRQSRSSNTTLHYNSSTLPVATTLYHKEGNWWTNFPQRRFGSTRPGQSSCQLSSAPCNLVPSIKRHRTKPVPLVGSPCTQSDYTPSINAGLRSRSVVASSRSSSHHRNLRLHPPDTCSASTFSASTGQPLIEQTAYSRIHRTNPTLPRQLTPKILMAISLHQQRCIAGLFSFV